MKVRAISAVLLIILTSWVILEVMNGFWPVLGLSSFVGLLGKCAAIGLFGGAFGFGLGTWAEKPETEAAPSYAAVGPWLGIVHFGNYASGTALIGLHLEVAAMIVGAFVVQALAAAIIRNGSDG